MPVADTALITRARDVGLLTTIVRQIVAERRAYRVIVDPRPLYPFDDPHEGGLADVPLDVVRLRETALRGLNVEVGDAYALGQNARCPGSFVFPARRGDDPHARCPKDRRYVVSIGLPRPGRARLPAGEVYNLLAGTAEGYWAVRVVGTIVEPSGSVAAGHDYVMTRDAAGWKLVKVVALYYSE